MFGPINIVDTLVEELKKTVESVFQVKVNNKNLHKVKTIKTSEVVNVSDVIIDKDFTIIKDGTKNVVLKKSKEDDYNLEYAFLYGYFLLTTGMSKTQAKRFLGELKEVNKEDTLEEQIIDKVENK